MRQQLIVLLRDLDGVAQDPAFHPEGDALTHTLQVYGHARAAEAAPHLLAAALLHDVGKVHGTRGHAERGAAWLHGLVPPRTVLLVRHHMDLIRPSRRVRRRLAQAGLLDDLQRLRRFDVAGRRPGARVCSITEAVDTVLDALSPQPHATEDDRS